MIRLPFVLVFSTLLFSVGVYGVLARRNAVMVLMAIELMLNAVNVNLIAFSSALHDVGGQIFALFVIAVAAAEVGIGLAIVILFLFGLMLTKAPIGRDSLDNNRRWLGALVALGVFAGLVFLIQEAFPFDSEQFAVFRSTTEDVGESMFRDYVLPFEAISFLLLAALIGAIVLARKDEGN